jgi:hypothetical protein
MILTAASHGLNTPYTMSISGVRAYVPPADVSLQLATPKLQGATVQAQSLALTWSALSGQMYQVQCSTNLGATNWLNLGNSITAANSTASISNAITNRQQYYRVIWLH